MDRYVIDWSTASVSQGAGGFDLSVELEGDVSHDWQALFNEAAQQDGLRSQDRSWGLVRISERSIVMERLDPGARDRARAYLSDIVERTNQTVAAKLEAEERERLRAEREEAELRRAAEELADWFRSAPDNGPAPSSAIEADEAARPEEALRSRLAHTFGSDPAET
jgi:hypothetical protein